jgi:hypothetical protein
MRSPARSLVILGVALAAAAPLAATPASDGHSNGVSRLAEEGLSLLRKVLHVPQQPDAVVSHAIALSSRDATLELDLASGKSRVVSLRGGDVIVDGQRVGRYVAGGALDKAWRKLLADGASLETRQVVQAVRTWKVPGLAGDELAARGRIDSALRDLASAPPTIPAGAAAAAAPSAPESVRASFPAQPLTAESAPPLAPQAPPAGPSGVQLLFQDVRTIVAIFVALAMIGFGVVFFARRYVEVIADTAANAFGRSLVVGLLGQLLLLPTLAMLIVGLIFTIVGILLLPFAILAFVVAVVAAALGGYLAVAHAVGETWTRRRMANGAFVRNPNAYGYLFTGLVGLLGLWAAAALFGWAGPVVFIFRAAAFVVTWLAATVGFGAVLLSRAGLRETFAGRHAGELSDEYLWATPPATPAAPRQGRRE